MNFSSDNLFTVHAAPVFWEFLLGKEADRRIITAKPYVAPCYGATTCVRIAFKAFEMSLKFDLGNVDFTQGTLANSQKEKFDKMKSWVDSPFHGHQCNKCRNYFVLRSKHHKVQCVACGPFASANSRCSYKMCKKCCVKHTSDPSVDAPYKVKGHHSMLA